MNTNQFIKDFAEALEISDASGLSVETKFKQLENWGSLSTVNLVVMVEEKYNTELTPLQIRKCNTIGDIIDIMSE